VYRSNIENPTLKDATMAALEVLSHDPDGFFVMIEQGDIDWANHANDFPWMIGTFWDLNNAVKAAVDFVDNPFDDVDWDNTLLIVTSDHSNSYMRNVQKLAKGDLPGAAEIQKGYVPGSPLAPEVKVTYSTGGHTNELTSLYAHGSQAEPLFKKYEGTWYPGTNILDNTQLYKVMVDAAGVN
jgi:alkaline phosphatase